MYKNKIKHTLVIVFILLSMPANSDVPPQQKIEIEHLLNFIKTTHCKVTRNGSTYEGSEAVNHIKIKYEYFEEEIETTEQFILMAATKSTMSGKFYTVQCGENKPQKTKQWLLKELVRYREDNGS